MSIRHGLSGKLGFRVSPNVYAKFLQCKELKLREIYLWVDIMSKD